MGLDRSPEQLIKSGLTALKQKDYGRAIATFQQLSQADNVSASYRLKAQMGLIRTYEAQEAIAQAQELCKPLLKSPSQAIRQWTQDKLQQLDDTLKQSHSTAEPTSGFVPETTSGFIPSTDTPTTAPENPPPSLFHYQTLNQSSEDSEIKPFNTPKSLDSNKSSLTTTNQAKSSSETPIEIAPKKRASQPDPQPDIPAHRSHHLTPVTSANGPESWPQGDRLSTLKSLGKVSTERLWFAQLITIPVLFLVIRWLVKTALTFIGNYLDFIRDLSPIYFRLSPFFWKPQYWTVLISLGLLTLAAPWLWPLLLGPKKQLNSSQLQTYSPEAVNLLRRLCTKRRWPFPKIQLLTSELPLIFSYGWRPRYGQLIVSQGLLEQLEPDELAAIIMYEISHWPTLDWIAFSTLGLILQGCHRTYWFFARWGEDRPNTIRIGCGILANLSYCIFWLLSKLSCGLARTRTPYRDRIAAELTGNPHGLVRALAKLSSAMADAIEEQGYTPPLLESLDTILPVGPQRPGASAQQYAWGAVNPLRHWLSINQPHPPLGDRLYLLSAYGRHWQLRPSLSFTQLRHEPRSLSTNDWRNLLLQGGPWSGLIVGLGIAILMWLIGAIATNLDIPLLDWLYKDWSILIGIPLICSATSQLLRINSFFPDITNIPTTGDAQFSAWQSDQTLTPLNHRPIKINGILTGRPDLANWLGQEWRLKTPQGSIKLHYASYIGPLSNIKGLAPWLNKSLQVTGWLRRGHHPWVDIDHLKHRSNDTKASHHAIWSVISSIIPLIYGLWLIFRGG
ncbi:MAG: M48 family metalloprotease [Leptolyngbyaceae cyanobacterium MAG.088]|nr:M48 family metalloprotease [Leptolyngbyaceae cyanobacterium MAG.088]